MILKSEDRLTKLNALLDDASRKIYVNTDVATVLGLKGKTEKVTVNVLNGQTETVMNHFKIFDKRSIVCYLMCLERFSHQLM